MNMRQRIILVVLSSGLLSLACGLLSPASPPPPAVGQSPASPNVTDAPPATELPPQPFLNNNLPSGLATASENTITFFDSNGAQLSQVVLPQVTYPHRSNVHIAGKLPKSGSSIPLFYFSYDEGEALLFRDSKGQISTLIGGIGFIGLTGVPGQETVAFSEVEYLDTTLRSKMFVGNVGTLPSAAPVSVIDDPEHKAIKPIRIESENAIASQVWYTRMPYGIGGDIIFEPRNGLFVLDITSGQVNTILDNSVAPWEISVDKNWVAYSKVETQSNAMCVKNFQTGAEICFPALLTSNPRGAGDGHFSPDAQYIAWMEGDGWQMSDGSEFKSSVRVGQNNGVIVADLPMNTFESTANLGAISRAQPVAWLDNQNVIVQVHGQVWDQAALVGYNVSSNVSKYLAPGEFIGLLYP